MKQARPARRAWATGLAALTVLSSGLLAVTPAAWGLGGTMPLLPCPTEPECPVPSTSPPPSTVVSPSTTSPPPTVAPPSTTPPPLGSSTDVPDGSVVPPDPVPDAAGTSATPAEPGEAPVGGRTSADGGMGTADPRSGARPESVSSPTRVLLGERMIRAVADTGEAFAFPLLLTVLVVVFVLVQDRIDRKTPKLAQAGLESEHDVVVFD